MWDTLALLHVQNKVLQRICILGAGGAPGVLGVTVWFGILSLTKFSGPIKDGREQELDLEFW